MKIENCKLKIRLQIILSVIFFALTPLHIRAQPALLPACAESGNCGFCDIVDVVGRGFEFALYFLGATIFFVFVWGAFDLIVARGRSEQVEKGKEEMKGAIFGLLFVLIAWHIINVTVYVLKTPSGDPLAPQKGKGGKGGVLFANPWNWLCEKENFAYLPENQKECFSRGDGTPCGNATVQDGEGKPTGTAQGVCIKGVCSIKYDTTCDYLKAAYPDEFNASYKCDPEPKSPPPDVTKDKDCLPDFAFCGLNNTTQLCCGLIPKAKTF
ncbi:MAG: hypothetical protein HY564_02765 [Candidatus Jacksonbacteria bacterium]|nr:hypothetical protein [Candidatus Jacksonbacteria bacterium]